MYFGSSDFKDVFEHLKRLNIVILSSFRILQKVFMGF